MPAAPASKSLLIKISSLEGNLTRGKDPARSMVLMRFSASYKSITLCSKSTVNQSKPELAKISAIAGCERVIHVPRVSSLFDNFFFSLFILTLILVTHQNSVIQ